MENKVLCTRITLYTTNKKHEREREKGKLCIEKIFPISKALHVPIFCIFLYRYYYYSVFVFYFSFFLLVEQKIYKIQSRLLVMNVQKNVIQKHLSSSSCSLF